MSASGIITVIRWARRRDGVIVWKRKKNWTENKIKFNCTVFKLVGDIFGRITNWCSLSPPLKVLDGRVSYSPKGIVELWKSTLDLKTFEKTCSVFENKKSDMDKMSQLLKHK